MSISSILTFCHLHSFIFSLYPFPRGLCTVARSEAGTTRRVGPLPAAADGDAVQEGRGIADSLPSSSSLQQSGQGSSGNHHAHWMKDGLPSRTVVYYDAASLYPSSGKNCPNFLTKHDTALSCWGGSIPPLFFFFFFFMRSK